NHEITYPAGHDRGAITPDDGIIRPDHVSWTGDDIALGIVRTHSRQRLPGADVVPGEITRHDDDAVAALQNANVDRNRGDGVKETGDVARIKQRQVRGYLRRAHGHLLQQGVSLPGEEPAVPEGTAGHQ